MFNKKTMEAVRAQKALSQQMQGNAVVALDVPKAVRPTVLKGLEHVDAWLRAEANNVLSTPPTEKTVEQYRRNGLRIDALRVSGQPVDLSDHETHKSTYYTYRASVRYHAAEQGLKALIDYEKAKRIGDAVAKATAYQALLHYAADLKQFPRDAKPGLPNAKYVANGLDDAKPDGIPTIAKKQGKTGLPPRETAKLKAANGISKRYPEWRSMLWQRLTEVKSPWLDQAAIASLTGARPEELRTVKVERIKDALRITITGAKVSESKGQPWRKITVQNDGSPEWWHLYGRAATTKNFDVPQTVKDYPDAFSAALARAGAQVFSKSTPRMSGYVYRHAFASDLKADGFAREQIAACLGHAVTKTQDAYGRAIGGKSGVRKVSVECAREVKVTHDTRLGVDAPSIEIQTMTYQTPTFNFDDLGL